eukprot:3591760-Prymnesium_polylepis.1
MPSRVARAQTQGRARAHTHTTADRARVPPAHRPVGGWRAASWHAQLAPCLRMAPAAAAHEQAARASQAARQQQRGGGRRRG